MAETNLADSTRIPTFVNPNIRPEPSHIPEQIRATVKRAIDTAPIVSVDQNHPKSFAHWIHTVLDDSDNRGLITFNVPEDVHLMPLLEKEIFNQFMDLIKHEKILVEAASLMCVDPDLGRFVREKFPDRKIFGETILEHELQHILEAKDRSHPQKIMLRLIKTRFPTGETVIIAGAFIHDGKSKENELMIDISSALAPKHPSTDDIEHAITGVWVAFTKDSDVLPFENPDFIKIHEYIESIINSKIMTESLVEAWIDYRHLGPHSKLIEA